MKLIKPSYEIWEQTLGETQEELLIGVYKQIERAARVCYKSEDKITEDSAEKFINQLINNQHYAMLEHGTVYLFIPSEILRKMDEDTYLRAHKLATNKYSKVNVNKITNKGFYITTNYRVIIENHFEPFLSFLCTPTEFHEKRITVHFTCNRQVSHEFVRHRVFSFAQESTRYCNYTKGKFGSELVFINPCWNYNNTLPYLFETVEANYFAFIANGWTPQQAATVLPNAIKTELVMTGFISDWKHFFDLRALGTTGAPHPQAKELAEPLMNEFKQLNLL